ncbi:MAG: MFS transporter [Leifsonia sp.]|nr:MFS transporter [Leifsonia sp.]|tara:strand:- start:53436 stop:54893 length:1458 start_codon:yes stop_codon:yes gene_type:complete
MDSSLRTGGRRTEGLRAGIVARYALGSVGTGGFGTLPGLVLVYYLTDTLGVTALLAGVLVTLAKVWDVMIDPIIGARSDRQIAATGYRRRFMVIGAVFLPIFFVLTFAVPAGLPAWASAIWVFLAFLLAATAFSLFQVPYIALPAELVSDYNARTRLLSARVVVLTFAILLFGAGGPALRSLGGDDSHLGYLIMAVVAGLVLGGSFLVTSTVEKAARVGGAPRPPVSEPVSGLAAPRETLGEHYRRGVRTLRTSQPFRALLITFVLQALATGIMLAGAQYVARYVLHDEDAVTFIFLALIAPALVFAPIWGTVANRIGKERAFAVASTMYGIAALAMVALAWFPGSWVYGPVALAGAAYAGMQSLPLAMLPDVIAVDARRHGPGRAGTFSGVWTAGETTGMALGTTVLAIILTVTGYLESTAAVDVEQSASAVLGIVVSFSAVPALLILVSLITLRRYPLRKVDIDEAAVAPVVPGAPPASEGMS